MKSLQEVAKNLGVEESSVLANRFYKLQFIDKNFAEIHENKFITLAELKELKSLVTVDDFGLLGDDVIASNKKRRSEITNNAISLEEAYILSISIK